MCAPAGAERQRGYPNTVQPLTHIRHSPNPSCRTPIRYPWRGVRARLPPPTHHPVIHPSPVVPDSDPVPMARGTGAATPPTCYPLPTSVIPPTRLPRPPYPVFPDSDRGPRGARLPPPTPSTLHVAGPRKPCTTKETRASTRLTGGTRYPRWGAGRARLSPTTSRPSPTSGILATRRAGLRAGTQGARLPQHRPTSHAPARQPTTPRRGRSRTALVRCAATTSHPSHTTAILATRRAGLRSGTHGAGYGRGYHPNPQNHQTPSHPIILRRGGFQTRPRPHPNHNHTTPARGSRPVLDTGSCRVRLLR